MSQPSGSTADDEADLDLQLAFGDDEAPPHRPVADQRAVMASYFEGSGRVVVDASAGTGKTTTLVVTLAETIVRRADETTNPLSDMLVTTFGRDATAELKTRLKQLLRQHVAAGGELPEAVFRWIDTDSTIQTLDSLFGELLREIAIEVAVPPDFSVDDRLELQALREDVFEELRAEYSREFRELRAAYPDESWREYPPDSVEELLYSAQQNCREFGISTAEAADSLRESLVVGHGGEGGRWLNGTGASPDSIPPETVDDVTAILRAVVSEDAELSYEDPADAQQLLTHVRETYFATEAAIESFATLLDAFEAAYDSRTRQAGQFTFTDVAHLLSSYLDDCGPTAPFAQTLGERFDHVFVDEFQDTSAVQCAVLRRLVDPSMDDPSMDDSSMEEPASTDPSTDSPSSPDHRQRANLFLIGDTKQAIYEWRSADPALFAEIIETARQSAPEPAPQIPHLGVRDVHYHALTTVFRHHPDIAAAANHVFQRLLEDGSRGAIGDHDPSYVPVDPYEPSEAATTDDSHVHVLNVGAAADGDLTSYISAADWATAEARRIGETIRAMTAPTGDEPPVTVRTAGGEDGESHRQPTLGDITLLCRSTRQLERYARVLREEYDIPAEAVATGDLFDQPEIELLVDLVSWLATPDPDHLRRLLRSPLVALADETIRAVLTSDADPATLVEAWPASLPAADRQRLAGLLELREDLRWELEASKTALIHRLLQHAGLDAVLLADSSGLRRYGNIWLLTELVDDWEVDELLSARAFVSRLQRLRAASDGTDPAYSVADLTDTDGSETVTLTTVHRAKGQEYPIVFLCDLPKQSTLPRLQADRLVMSRQYGFALRPRPGSAPSPSTVRFPTPDSDLDQPVWFNDDRSVATIPDVTGPVWLSDARTDTGILRYPNPLNAHLTAREAEFWRLAYVAFTRAEDHVFLGLGQLDEDDDYYDQIRWSTWLAGFNETLAPESGWDPVTNRESRTIHRELSWRLRTGETVAQTVPIGVDELPAWSADSTDSPELTAELDRLDGAGDRLDTPEYRPRTLSASSLLDLDSCPRAFQYRHVQEIDASNSARSDRTDTARSSQPPGSLSATEWGDIVHRLLERQLDDVDDAEHYRKEQPTAVRERLKPIQAAVETSEIAAQCQSAGAERVTEYDLSVRVPTPGADLRVTGTVDLLYRIDGGWHLVDWKTGHRPVGGADTHRKQLSVYAWLLAEQFGIDLESATLGYMDPDREPVLKRVSVTADLDTDWVERTVEAAGESVPIPSGAGLETRPDPDHCGRCPYASSAGGPCSDDYHTTEES